MITKYNTYNLITENSKFYNELKYLIPLKYEQIFSYLINNDNFRIKNFKIKEHILDIDYDDRVDLLFNNILNKNRNCLLVYNTKSDVYYIIYNISKDENLKYITYTGINREYTKNSIEYDAIHTDYNKYYEIEVESLNIKFEDVYNLYVKHYDKVITKISENLFYKIKKILIEHLSKLDKYIKDEYNKKKDIDYNYSHELQKDLENLSYWKEAVITYKQFEILLSNKIYKESGVKNVKEFESYVNRNINLVCKKVLYIQYIDLIDELYIKKYELWDKLLSTNVDYWQMIKNKINDKTLLNKYKHLDNANNFDIL